MQDVPGVQGGGASARNPSDPSSRFSAPVRLGSFRSARRLPSYQPVGAVGRTRTVGWVRATPRARGKGKTVSRHHPFLGPQVNPLAIAWAVAFGVGGLSYVSQRAAAAGGHPVLPGLWFGPSGLPVELVAAVVVLAVGILTVTGRKVAAVGVGVLGSFAVLSTLGPVYAPWAVFLWQRAGTPELVAAAAGKFRVMALLGGAGLLYAYAMANQSPKDLHGSGRWATLRELREARYLDQGPSGIPLGAAGKRAIVHRGNEHALCVGRTRFGKTAGYAVPGIMAWQDHMVIFDPKDRELFELTSAGKAEQGFTVIHWDVLGDGVSWNPLFSIRCGEAEIGELQTLAEALIPEIGASADHWEGSARTLFVGLALHVLYANPVKSRTMAAILELLSVGGGVSEAGGKADDGYFGAQVAKILMARPHDPLKLYGWKDENGKATQYHPEVVKCAGRLLSTPPKEMGSIASTLARFLQPWADPRVARATEDSDFFLSQIRESKKPVAIYVTAPLGDMRRLAPVVRLFLVKAADIFRRTPGGYRDAGMPGARRRVLMLVDEFAAVGRMTYISSQLATMAGYGVVFVLFIQSLTQLRSPQLYGEREEISAACPVKVIGATGDSTTRKFASETLGDMTVRHRRRSRSSGRGGASVSDSWESTRRRLLTEEEVGALPEDKVLLLLPGCRGFIATKRMYFEDVRFEVLNIRGRIGESDVLPDPCCAWKFRHPVRREIPHADVLGKLVA